MTTHLGALGRVSGRTLRALALTMRVPLLRRAATRALRGQLGIEAARALPAAARGPLPASYAPLRARHEHARPSENWGAPVNGEWPRTIASFEKAYAEREVTPLDVVERALAAARKLSLHVPSLGPLCDYDDEPALAAARASTERWQRGAPLGASDGVPTAVKEEIDVAGLPTRMGTGFMPYFAAERDAIAVARLRARGLCVIGQTPMTEYGLSPVGVNAHRRMPRNAHHLGRVAGGSSTGSAVAVALGITPVALGTDGGGSIRVPAAFNGIFGIKPTYGRVPLLGKGGPGTSSVIHIGPLGASTRDLALALGALSGPHPADELSTLAPELAAEAFVGALGRGVRGLRIGIDEDEFASAAPDVARVTRAALDALGREGATLVPLRLPLARHATAIGYMTIALEAFAGLRDVRAAHFDELGYDVQVLLAGLSEFSPDDYLDAQRLRAGLRRDLAAALRDVDVIALPSTAATAPAIDDAEARSGIVDPKALDQACRFAFLANLTGLPAVSVPVGSDADGLPVGLQLVGDAWDEACVLAVAAHLERVGVARVTRPAAAVDLLA